jgi:hypothetical protein
LRSLLLKWYVSIIKWSVNNEVKFFKITEIDWFWRLDMNKLCQVGSLHFLVYSQIIRRKSRPLNKNLQRIQKQINFLTSAWLSCQWHFYVQGLIMLLNFNINFHNNRIIFSIFLIKKYLLFLWLWLYLANKWSWRGFLWHRRRGENFIDPHIALNPWGIFFVFSKV